MSLPHIMLDLETLGTRSDAVIISIGAVKFDPCSTAPSALDPKGFYASVSVDSNHDAGARIIDEDTLAWWMAQSDAARRVFLEPKTTLGCALEELAEYIDDPACQVWSNGASFDIAVLEHAYKSFGLPVPWKHTNTNCYRTFKKLPSSRGVGALPQQDKHHALADARYQARMLQQYHAALGFLAAEVA